MAILVTGGSGHFGSLFLRRLEQGGNGALRSFDRADARQPAAPLLGGRMRAGAE